MHASVAISARLDQGELRVSEGLVSKGVVQYCNVM
jgi:hypothetical protein